MVPFRQPRVTEMGHTATVVLATGGLTPRPATQVTTEFLMVVIQATELPRTLALVIRGHMAPRCIPARAMDHQEDMVATEQAATVPEVVTEASMGLDTERVMGQDTERVMGLDTEGVMGLMVATEPTMDYKPDIKQVSSKSQRKLSMIG